MQKTFFNTNLQSCRAINTGLTVYSIYESIVIDKVCVNGITNFGLEIKNNSPTANITEVCLYGSPNGFEYFLQETNIFANTIKPGELQHAEFNIVTGFIRISVQTDANANIDVYLHGNIS